MTNYQLFLPFFSKMPYGARTLDYYSPDKWPTPWEILYSGKFCKNSISLLMFYTLTLTGSDNNVELHLINDNEDMYLVPVIDSKYVLNYELVQVCNFEELVDQFVVKLKYTESQIKK